jgi:indole-3-glycerol phosphate synthase / phosphoribosylanthranilate isomerase
MGRFRDSLAGSRLSAIAEVKRRSPSAGDLRPDADPGALARQFATSGAAAVSILVDERFGGSFADLRAARAASSVPLLAKGFFRRREDLEEICASGADAALILLRDVDDTTARVLLGTCRELGLDALVEAHDGEELERAAALDAEIVGVNARDLATFRIDRRAQLELVARAPRNRVLVAESGVTNRAQGAEAELAGASAILVGSALMRAPDPAGKLEELLARPLVKVCGLTREEDVAVAAEAGADLAGFVLAESPRRADGPLAVPETMLSVSVFVGEAEHAGTDLVQLYPAENGHRARDGMLLREEEPVARVLDLPWEDEDPGHWERAARADERVLLAGGLGPDNVQAAIEAVRPWCVDASRSLEAAPGIKDHERVRAFVGAARCVARLRLAPVGENMFPPRAPFFETVKEPPGSLTHPPHPHRPEAGL